MKRRVKNQMKITTLRNWLVLITIGLLMLSLAYVDLAFALAGYWR